MSCVAVARRVCKTIEKPMEFVLESRDAALREARKHTRFRRVCEGTSRLPVLPGQLSRVPAVDPGLPPEDLSRGDAREGGKCAADCVGACPQQGALDAASILTVGL